TGSPTKIVWSPVRITSCSVHSIQARQPSISGASIISGANVSSPAASSLFVSSPVCVPRNAVCFRSDGPGMLMANASLNLIMSAVCRCGLITQPTSGGSIERGAVHAMGAALNMPRHAVVTIATGPGFSMRRASVGLYRRRMCETSGENKRPGVSARPSKCFVRGLVAPVIVGRHPPPTQEVPVGEQLRQVLRVLFEFTDELGDIAVANVQHVAF